MSAEKIKATLWAVLVTGVLARLIVLGSGNLEHFDAVLVGYTFAILFAAFGITRRYALWLQRPPTAMYWRRGWKVFWRFLRPRHISANLAGLVRRLTVDFALNGFIWRRGKMRWLAHACIMWGCIIAAVITFPLVFGWMHFVTEGDGFHSYRMVIFGQPTIAFSIHSLAAFLIFHGLVWSSVLVIIGVLLALRRRLRDHGAAALQQFGEDILPLLLLFAISVTGLMLTASYTWMKGYAYDFLAILHALTVIFTLLWLPFGKLFHIFQRSAQIGVAFYKDVAGQGEQAHCRRCGQEFAARMHIEDLIAVEEQLGYRYRLPGSPAEHFQWVCPRCRRALLGLAQGALWTAASAADAVSHRDAEAPREKHKNGRMGPSLPVNKVLCLVAVYLILLAFWG
jgi:hypothetical protein